jgi:hypothetical protein
MKSVNLKLDSVEVKSKTKSLKCELTREVAANLITYGELNIDDLAQEIVRRLRVENRRSKIIKIFDL